MQLLLGEIAPAVELLLSGRDKGLFPVVEFATRVDRLEELLNQLLIIRLGQRANHALQVRELGAIGNRHALERGELRLGERTALGDSLAHIVEEGLVAPADLPILGERWLFPLLNLRHLLQKRGNLSGVSREPRRQLRIEVGNLLLPIERPFCHLVQIVLHLRGERHVDEVGHLPEEIIGGSNPHFGGGEHVPLTAGDVLSRQERADGCCVGGRSPNAVLFERVHEGRLVEACRRLRLFALAEPLPAEKHVARRQDGELLGVELLLVVLEVVPHIEEALEDHLLRRRREAVAVLSLGRLDRLKEERGALKLCRSHLACHEPPPDEVVELGLVRIDAVQAHLRDVRRADRLVGFLRVLDLVPVDIRLLGDAGCAEEFFDFGIDRFTNRRAHGVAIGTHVGNKPFLVERLRQAHGLVGRIAQLRRGSLLKGRGNEGWLRSPGERLLLYRADGELVPLQIPQRRRGVSLRGNAVDLFPIRRELGSHAVDRGQPCIETALPLLQPRPQEPIGRGLKVLNGALAVDNQAQRHGLHAPCAPRPAHRVSDEFGNLEPRKAVFNAPGLLGVNQVLVNRRGVLQRV